MHRAAAPRWRLRGGSGCHELCSFEVRSERLQLSLGIVRVGARTAGRGPRGRRSLVELKHGPWLDLMRGQLTYEQSRALEREAPERLEVPSGSHIRVEYEEGRPPVLAARIQELFGLIETPRLASGRVKVLLHLLAPNHRPQQVTDDLASFWATTYPQVRKELRARYPRHAWPEDPWTAPPERRPQRRRPGGG